MGAGKVGVPKGPFREETVISAIRHLQAEAAAELVLGDQGLEKTSPWLCSACLVFSLYARIKLHFTVNFGGPSNTCKACWSAHMTLQGAKAAPKGTGVGGKAGRRLPPCPPPTNITIIFVSHRCDSCQRWFFPGWRTGLSHSPGCGADHSPSLWIGSPAANTMVFPSSPAPAQRITPGSWKRDRRQVCEAVEDISFAPGLAAK